MGDITGIVQISGEPAESDIFEFSGNEDEWDDLLERLRMQISGKSEIMYKTDKTHVWVSYVIPE